MLRDITLINISAAHRWSNNFRGNSPQKRYPYHDRTGRIFPPGGYVAGTELLVSTSLPRQRKQRYLVKIRIQPQYSSSDLPYLSAFKQFTLPLTLLAFVRLIDTLMACSGTRPPKRRRKWATKHKSTHTA